MNMDRESVRELLRPLQYVGGINGDTDIYCFRDPATGQIWEIAVDRHDDDGHELSNEQIALHATWVWPFGQAERYPVTDTGGE